MIHRGNALPWLLASRALVHNGCTTALEGYAMGVPSVAYLKPFDTRYDMDFQGLPNRLSVQCFEVEELTAMVRAVGDGNGPVLATPERDALMDHYVTARTGLLASERILDVLDAKVRQNGAPRPAAATRLRAAVLANIKTAATKLYMHRPGRNRANYHDHRFPRLEAQDVARLVQRLGQTLGRFRSVQVRERSEHLFDVFTERGGST